MLRKRLGQIVDGAFSGLRPEKACFERLAEDFSPIQLPVEVKAGFRLPDGTPINFAPALGNDKHLETVLPQGFKYEELFLSMTVPPVPPGRYCYEVGWIHPELLSAFSPSKSAQCFLILP